MANLRLFIGIDTPSHIRAQLSSIQQELKKSGADVRWEPEEKFHATLKFLGSTDENLLGAITNNLEDVCRRSDILALRYSELGCFPSKRDPRVIWAGVQSLDANLQVLYERVEESMAGLGFKKENRDFHPHITFGRVKGRRNLNSLISKMETVTFESQPVTLREIVVFKSELKPSGSIYTSLKSIPLNV